MNIKKFILGCVSYFLVTLVLWCIVTFIIWTWFPRCLPKADKHYGVRIAPFGNTSDWVVEYTFNGGWTWERLTKPDYFIKADRTFPVIDPNINKVIYVAKQIETPDMLRQWEFNADESWNAYLRRRDSILYIVPPK